MGTITEDMINILALLYPPAIVLCTIKVSRTFGRKVQDGRTACAMLVMVYIFAAVPDEEGLERYARLCIGLAYANLMVTYCRIVTVKNRRRKEGCCIFAIALAIAMIIFAVSSAPVWNYLAGLAGMSIVFGLSLAVPLAFATCAAASFLLIKIVMVIRDVYGLFDSA